MVVYGNNYIMPQKTSCRYNIFFKENSKLCDFGKINASIRAYIRIIHYFCN